MTEKEYILNELNELQSQLAKLMDNPLYEAPIGYFEQLPINVLQLAKASEAEDPAIETGYLSTMLATMPKHIPYIVPEKYFENLPGTVLEKVLMEVEADAVYDETITLAPIFGQLEKKMPFAVPADYFKNVSIPSTNKQTTSGKIISFNDRKWFRIAVAACVSGIIVLSGLLYYNKTQQYVEPGSKSLAKFARDVKQMDESEKDSLVNFIDAGLTGDTPEQPYIANESEIKELLKDISEDELTAFKEQTEDVETVLMIN